MHRRQFVSTHAVRVALVCALLVCAQAELATAESPPYQARVIAAGAAVHSGPGENYYPTDTLAQGDLVEVYREKPGGWLAIRPPVNSFSWLAERDLILKDGGLAEIVKDDVASRIGSRLNDRRNAAQVRLKKGEAVEVLGEENVRGEKWYKIAPPAGEFRWIQSSVIERIGPIPSSSNVPASTANATAATLPAAEPKKDASSNVGPVSAASSAGDPAAPPLVSSAPSIKNTNATSSPMPPAGPVATDLSHDLSAIELRLSRMAAAPTNLWNTERLERDTAQLMARAKTTAERDAVRITQDKINRFAEIGHRYNQSSASIAESGVPGGAGSRDPRTTGGDPRTTGVATNASGGPYDAVGVLRPVVSRRPGAPQFALVDERGQVVSFVTPTPDLNLQPYLGHRVGVVGNRGFMQEFQRSNVTAARVTPLNDHMVR